ncbi:MAG TPA: cysteine desulfurase family protein [Sphingomicrobium sp.]|nr:cysteine desulfurase family protein [Sphingomicrobium sp.]
MTSIYLDAHANARLAPEAMEAMSRAYAQPGNPHAANAAGLRASSIVEQARAQVASLISAAPSEIIFTSGATEANNLAIIGLSRAAASAGDRRRTIATSAVEHASVTEAAKALVREGFRHVILPVDSSGKVSVRALTNLADGGDLLLVSVTAADGEIGRIQPIADIGKAAHFAGAIVHSDASQSAGRVGVDVDHMDVDALSISSHKMHGPAGIGALYINPAIVRPEPLLHGGGQERGIRPGTIPVALACGFGAAAAVAQSRKVADRVHCTALVEQFEAMLRARSVSFRVNGEREQRLPGSLNIRFGGVDGDSVIDALGENLAVSTGSACSSGKLEGSHVLRAIGLSEEEARSSVRLCFDRYNTPEEAAMAAESIAAVVKRFGIAAGEFVQ